MLKNRQEAEKPDVLQVGVGYPIFLREICALVS
jgi:hypothetical protein